MTDHHKQMLEQYFDGELDRQDVAELERVMAEDPQAMRYLNHLGLLRRVARKHDPAGEVATVAPARRVPSAASSSTRPARPWRRARLLAACSLAAGILGLLLIYRDRSVLVDGTPRPAAPRIWSERTSTPIGRVARPRTNPAPASDPLEIELIRWANSTPRGRASVARVFLARTAAPHRRSNAREILAIELANAESGDLQRLSRLVSPHPHLRTGSGRRNQPPHVPGPSTPQA